MKIYDISQEVFGCDVYKGDPSPQKQILKSIEHGETYNLTAFYMCTHNGTHIDAPSHFINTGAGIDQVPLEKVVGFAYVTEHNGVLYAVDAERIINEATAISKDAAKRILIKGDCTVTLEAARTFTESGIYLIGSESQTVGPEDAPMSVHLELLQNEVVILEGIRLGEVCRGIYFLCAAPISLKDTDGAPCRAILVDFDE